MNSAELLPLRQQIGQHLVGQEKLVESLLVTLLCDGHLLIEGMPGLAKTTAVKAMAEGLAGDFHRVQFTPDLLPSDLIGTDILNEDRSGFEFRPGPIFQNLLLADEINRAPAKVQSALLEAMAERQVSVGARTYPLPALFMVMATQNPVDQEGTYKLPEAQLDRFLLYTWVDYPDRQQELQILALDQARFSKQPQTRCEPLPQQAIFAARQAVASTYLDPRLEQYIVDLVLASRNPLAYDPELARWRQFGASPRATLALARCARAVAWLDGAGFVTPHHVQRIAEEVLSHRVILSFEAEADGVTNRQFVRRLLEVVAVP